MAEAKQQPGSQKQDRRIALISRTGRPRYRGGFIVPADKALVLDLDELSAGALGEIEGDEHILKVRSDMALTPKDQIETYKP